MTTIDSAREGKIHRDIWTFGVDFNFLFDNFLFLKKADKTILKCSQNFPNWYIKSKLLFLVLAIFILAQTQI